MVMVTPTSNNLKRLSERDWAKAPIYYFLSTNPVPKAFGTGQLQLSRVVIAGLTKRPHPAAL
jgi:hypothetical protein